MGDWTSFMRGDPIPWLLEEANPSVRYLTLRNLLGRDDSDPQVRDAKDAIMHSGVVPAILERQVDGRWNAPGRFYLDKYKGTVWQLIVLAEHEAAGEDDRIKASCEYILGCCQDRDSHGFSVNQSGAKGGGRHSEVIPCLTGNMAWSLSKLGYQNDPRVQKAVEWIAEYQRFDDGDGDPPRGWPYDRYEMCWGKHSCHMGVVKGLKALSVVPESSRSEAVKKSIGDGCEYFLRHHVYKRSHDLDTVSRPGWLKLQFPLMYQSDILEVVGILLDLGARDARMVEAMEKIVSKQDPQGRWRLEGTFNGKYQVDVERKGEPSRWITYRAVKAIKQFYGSP